MKKGKFALMLVSTVLMAACLFGCGSADSDSANMSAGGVQAAEEASESAQTGNFDDTEKQETAETGNGLEVDDLAVDAVETEENTMKVLINGKEYTAILDQGKAAQELKNMLPLTLAMQELNGNEKYGDLPESLTQDVYSPGEIHTGDILLWGADTLVVFYKDFPTQYRYTKIGRISNPEGLQDAVGGGSTQVTFQ